MLHTFHIPVMGTGFSIDTPAKVAHYGISSVISLVDDTLIEQMRKFYCQEYHEAYTPITKYDQDFRARRITEYLNLLDRIVKKNFEALKQSPFEAGSEIVKYFDMLPDTSFVKALYNEMNALTDASQKLKLQEKLRTLIRPGDINVNIMTKLDRANVDGKGVDLGSEFSDALSALRGYALSTVASSIVFSAGINRRLYSYVEKFDDFYADAAGFIKKKIILKVTDYRSSIIQGKFFAKKGIWVSEYRMESGLNCGGHAFASDGYLMGPILEEFKSQRPQMISDLHATYCEAAKSKNKFYSDSPLAVKITAQGGIGTANEQAFLMDYYELDSTGWGTPFLLVPEATSVDEATLQKLSAATEKDLYLSDVSPLGVPFNNLKDNFSDMEKERKVELGKPGSACPKGHLVSNTEFTEAPICTASRQYQKLKIEQLEKLNLSLNALKSKIDDVTKKACICHQLGDSALIKNKVETRTATFPAICPGPNLAYFSKVVTLKEMVDHIYGRINLLNSTYRPNMFIKELKLYLDYFTKEVKKTLEPTDKQIAYLNEFKNNLLDGIEYYKTLFPKMTLETESYRQKALHELAEFKANLEKFVCEYSQIFGEHLPKLAVI